MMKDQVGSKNLRFLFSSLTEASGIISNLSLSRNGIG